MRKIWDFHGGIHPPENKLQSLLDPIRSAGIPPRLTLPLSQHMGAPAVPVVATGDRVLKGQLIAHAHGLISVPVHAPSSGTVIAVDERPVAHPSGFLAPCIVIETDGKDEWIEHSGVENFASLDKATLLEAIRNAGIAGLGGAGFPTAVKLAAKPGTRIDTLVINGTECEPYITADDALMRERPGEIVAGAQILAQLLEAEETLLGVEDNKPEAIEALRAAAEGTGIEVVSFPTKYPSGGEKQLIEILTGKQVPSGGLPADIGVVCQNTGTAVAVYRAVVHGEPLISRITTLTGAALDHPQNYETLLGTPMSYLLQLAGFDAGRSNRLIMGGPMMGFTVPSPEVPVVKATNCILAPTEAELPTPLPAQACIRCGMCAEVCPASLLPQQMFWFAQGKEFEKLEQHKLFDCIECGACSWVCPSHIPLVQYYRASKAEVLQLKRDNEKSERSRERFEARQQRKAREEAEREAKRAARKQAAEEKARAAASGTGDASEDPIQAAIERAKAKKAAQQAGAGTVDEGEKLQQAVATTRKRLATAEAKLAEAQATGSDLVDALRSGVDKTRAKLEKAEQALAEFQSSATEAAQGSAAQAAGEDAAQAAIRRAREARAAQSSQSPLDKARDNLEKLQQRLAKSQAKLDESRASGEQDKVIEALESTVERLGGKIDQARQELAGLEDS